MPVEPASPRSLPDTPPSLTAWLERLSASPATIALFLAVLIGGGTGFCVVLFRTAIDLLERSLFQTVQPPLAPTGAWLLVVTPLLGGLLVGGIRAWMPNFGQGLSGLKSAVQNAQEIPPLRTIAKTIAAIISLGTGASLGPEGPSVEIGATVGVFLGQVLRVSQERQALLLAAGAAAGVAAGFDAPIAGVFFAFEVALGTSFATSSASVVLLAAVLSSLVAQIGMGGNPAFSLPIYEVRSPLEFPLYLGLGACASLIAWMYTWLNRWMPKLFRGEVENFEWFGRIPNWAQPMLGGTIVGLVALGLPEILGIGYDTIEAVLRDVEYPLLTLGLLLVAKLLLASLSLGSGLVGGIFAPSLFMGAVFGAVYGQALPILLPWFAEYIAAPPAYAMVGMAAVLAATARAPLTAILLLFELTRDYRIVLPLMAAVGISLWLFDLLLDPKANPIETVAAEVKIDDQVDQLRSIRQTLIVGDVMDQRCLRFAEPLLVTTAGNTLTENGRRSAVVLDGNERLVGIVTLRDINRVVSRWQTAQAKVTTLSANNSTDPDTLVPNFNWRELPEFAAVLAQTVGQISTKDVLVAYADESLSVAIDRMARRDLRQLPVVLRSDDQQVVGLLTREAIDLACRLALTRELLKPFWAMAAQPEKRSQPRKLS
jgi:H+/Cl- antiporter ClcA/CBS domain-containing protein